MCRVWWVVRKLHAGHHFGELNVPVGLLKRLYIELSVRSTMGVFVALPHWSYCSAETNFSMKTPIGSSEIAESVDTKTLCKKQERYTVEL